MTPEEAGPWAVGIAALVGMLVVLAMHRYPAGRRVLEAADAEDREEMLQPLRAGERAVRQEPVVAQVDAEGAENVSAEEAGRQAGPGE